MIRDIQVVDDDIARKKRIIEQKLYSDPDIIEVLDNPNLSPDSPEEYVYENIFPFIRIPGTQDLVKTKYGMARHDCLSYIIRDIFNLSNCIGPQMQIVSNVEGVADNNYLTRTLKFELIDDNSTKPFRTNPYEYNKNFGT